MIVQCINDDWKKGSSISNIAINSISTYHFKGYHTIPSPKKGDVVEVIKSVMIENKLAYVLREYNIPYPNTPIYKADHFAEVEVNIEDVFNLEEATI